MSVTSHTHVRPEFDPESGSHRVRHDTETEWEASTTLVLSLCSVAGDDPTEILPLNRAVDPDVLNGHVRGHARGAELTFQFHGHDVTVHDDGRIEFSPLDG